MKCLSAEPQVGQAVSTASPCIPSSVSTRAFASSRAVSLSPCMSMGTPQQWLSERQRRPRRPAAPSAATSARPISGYTYVIMQPA